MASPIISFVDSKNSVSKYFLSGKTKGLKLAGLISKNCDLLIRELFLKEIPRAHAGKISIVATGGYGRSEMFPMSDLDVLFLVQETGMFEREVKRIVYPLWDKKIDVSYSVRTADESTKLALTDMKVFTSLLDARLVEGSKNLFEDFKSSFVSDVLCRRANDFVKEITDLREVRKKRYGDSVYVLEPELKEGQGGLRDYHTALWLAKVRFGIKKFKELLGRGFLRQSTMKDLREAIDVIFDLRHRIQLYGKSKSDRLTFEIQEKIARDKKYKTTGRLRDVEKLMQRYYESAQAISSFCDLIIEKVQSLPQEKLFQALEKPKHISSLFGRTSKNIIAYSGKDFLKKPSNIIKAFVLSKKYALNLNEYLKEMIFDHVRTGKIVWDREAISQFKRLFQGGKGLFRTLDQMRRLRILDSIIPRFKKIRSRVHHDIYHTYTVDVHSLLAVHELEKLETGVLKREFPFLTSLMKELKPEEKMILYFAALLHDIGKGKGRDHSKRGQRIVLDVARALALNEKSFNTLSFLVGNHLLMSILAQRRNLNDPVMINKFASQVRNVNNLKLLYLLTFSDLRSVSGDGKEFTSWKNMLFRELYSKSMELFSLGRYKNWVFGKEIEEFKDRLAARFRNLKRKREFKKFLDSLPESYFRSFGPKEIRKHYGMMAKLKTKPFVTLKQYMDEFGISRLFVCTKNSPGLFASLAGALSGARITILNSLVFSTGRGLVIDSFRVQSNDGKPLTDDDYKWREFERLFSISLESKDEFSNQIRQRLARTKSILDTRLPEVDKEVRFDNEGSKEFTIIEVYAEDRLGLLYDISSALSDMNANIHFAKISTEGNKAQDIFYVTDLKGRKFTDAAILSSIRADLTQVVK